MDSCGIKPRDFSKPFEEYRKSARVASSILAEEIEEKGSITWDRVLQAADGDGLVYKLTLKYLRLNGYDIGNNSQPFVKKH